MFGGHFNNKITNKNYKSMNNIALNDSKRHLFTVWAEARRQSVATCKSEHWMFRCSVHVREWFEGGRKYRFGLTHQFYRVDEFTNTKSVTDGGKLFVNNNIKCEWTNPVKGQRSLDWMNKQETTLCSLQETYFKFKDKNRLKVKG